jgi:hypothetical protein
MATVTMGKFTFYNGFLKGVGDGAATAKYDLALAGGVKCMVVTSTYTPDVDNHSNKTSVTGEAAASNGYSAGGFACTTPTWTKSGTGTSAVYNFDHDDVAIANVTGAGITGKYLVFYIVATGQLIGYALMNSSGADVNFPAAASGNSITVPTGGWLGLSQA